MKDRRKEVLYWLLFLVTYFILAMVSLETRDPWSLSSTVWFPAGLVLGTLSISSRVYWPLWGVSAGVLHVSASLLYGRSLDIALVFASLDLAVFFLLATMWKIAYRYLHNISYLSGTLLSLMGIYIVSILGGLFSQCLLVLLDYPVIFSHFFSWSLSNAAGCLFGVPFFIVHYFARDNYPSFSFTQAGILVVITIVFLLPPNELLHNALLNQALLYLVLGISLILAMWWSLRTLAMYFTFLALLVSLTTLYGHGPLAIDALHRMQVSQLYLLAIISLGLLIAAHKKEHATLSDRWQQQLLLLSNLLKRQQPVFFQLSSDLSQLTWLHNEYVFDIPVEQIPTLPLFKARIHPDDCDMFSACLVIKSNKQQPVQERTLRLLLADFHYHEVRCSLAFGHPQSGALGVLLRST